MTTALQKSKAESVSLEPGNDSLILSGISWETYRRLLEDLDGKPSPRLNYHQGTLELMVLSPEHERFNRLFSAFFENLAVALKTDIEEVGATTFHREDLAEGFEADTSFYIRHAGSIRRKIKESRQKRKQKRVVIDLTKDPAPELIVEVDVTSGSLNKFPIYAAIGVQEVWHYDGRKVRFYQLVGADYHPVTRSVAFPSVTAKTVESYLDKSTELTRPELSAFLRKRLRSSAS
jgi:Uma2 family endonuclease